MLKHLVPPFMELTLIKYQMLNYKSKDFISLKNCVRAKLNHWVDVIVFFSSNISNIAPLQPLAILASDILKCSLFISEILQQWITHILIHVFKNMFYCSSLCTYLSFSPDFRGLKGLELFFC